MIGVLSKLRESLTELYATRAKVVAEQNALIDLPVPAPAIEKEAGVMSEETSAHAAQADTNAEDSLADLISCYSAARESTFIAGMPHGVTDRGSPPVVSEAALDDVLSRYSSTRAMSALARKEPDASLPPPPQEEATSLIPSFGKLIEISPDGSSVETIVKTDTSLDTNTLPLTVPILDPIEPLPVYAGDLHARPLLTPTPVSRSTADPSRLRMELLSSSGSAPSPSVATAASMQKTANALFSSKVVLESLSSGAEEDGLSLEMATTMDSSLDVGFQGFSSDEEVPSYLAGAFNSAVVKLSTTSSSSTSTHQSLAEQSSGQLSGQTTFTDIHLSSKSTPGMSRGMSLADFPEIPSSGDILGGQSVEELQRHRPATSQSHEELQSIGGASLMATTITDIPVRASTPDRDAADLYRSFRFEEDALGPTTAPQTASTESIPGQLLDSGQSSSLRALSPSPLSALDELRGILTTEGTPPRADAKSDDSGSLLSFNDGSNLAQLSAGVSVLSATDCLLHAEPTPPTPQQRSVREVPPLTRESTSERVGQEKRSVSQSLSAVGCGVAVGGGVDELERKLKYLSSDFVTTIPKAVTLSAVPTTPKREVGDHDEPDITPEGISKLVKWQQELDSLYTSSTLEEGSAVVAHSSMAILDTAMGSVSYPAVCVSLSLLQFKVT